MEKNTGLKKCQVIDQPDISSPVIHTRNGVSGYIAKLPFDQGGFILDEKTTSNPMGVLCSLTEQGNYTMGECIRDYVRVCFGDEGGVSIACARMGRLFNYSADNNHFSFSQRIEVAKGVGLTCVYAYDSGGTNNGRACLIPEYYVIDMGNERIVLEDNQSINEYWQFEEVSPYNLVKHLLSWKDHPENSNSWSTVEQGTPGFYGRYIGDYPLSKVSIDRSELGDYGEEDFLELVVAETASDDIFLVISPMLLENSYINSIEVVYGEDFFDEGGGLTIKIENVEKELEIDVDPDVVATMRAQGYSDNRIALILAVNGLLEIS